MKKFVIALALGAVTVGGVAPVVARSVNAKQVDQRRRIDAGERSGKLTHREAARLRAEQDAIEREEAQLRARNHGHLSARAKKVIHARQDRAERHILGQKDDAQRGPNKLKV